MIIDSLQSTIAWFSFRQIIIQWVKDNTTDYYDTYIY